MHLKVVPVAFSDTSSDSIFPRFDFCKFFDVIFAEFLKIKGVLFSRKFLLRVQKFCPLSWKYFCASLLSSNGRIYVIRVVLEEGN